MKYETKYFIISRRSLILVICISMYDLFIHLKNAQLYKIMTFQKYERIYCTSQVFTIEIRHKVIEKRFYYDV